MYSVMQQGTEAAGTSALDGLWLLLVDDDSQTPANLEGRVPMMARAGNDMTYLLGFKNAANARRFMQDSDIDDAEPRMVVRSNASTVIDVARANGVVGVLVDYDPKTREYARASEL
jgi:hypothetical protein